jgi:hypothetical protein
VVLSGLMSNGIEVVDLVYPVTGKGSFNHSKQDKVEEVNMIPPIQLLGTELGVHPRVHKDYLCCEASPQRIDVWDLFFRGMKLYLIRTDESIGGSLAAKENKYGCKEWYKVM